MQTVDVQADEKATDDVTQLLERLAIRESPTDQRAIASEWVHELKEKLQLECRAQGVLEALQCAGESLAKG